MRLSITVVNGRNLRSTQTFGKQDPYVKIKCNRLTRKTRTDDNGSCNANFNSHMLEMGKVVAGTILHFETWNENYVRVQMTIEIENGSEGMLKSLIKVGRYNLTGTESANGFEITMPNIVKKVTVGGQELNEKFSYIVYAPKGVSVQNLNEASASVEFE